MTQTLYPMPREMDLRCRPLEDRLWEKTQRAENGCLIWIGTKQTEGYGLIRINGRLHATHRVAWELTHGEKIPQGKIICHTCDNPSCIEPTHLYSGNDASNAADRESRGRVVKRLSEQKVRYIRAAVAAGRSTHSVAKELGIAQTTAYNITNGRSYKWVE